MKKILLVEDEKAIRNVLKNILKEESDSYVVEESENGLDAYNKIKETEYDLIISDIKMPKMEGTELLKKTLEIYPNTTFLMISGHGDIETAVDAIKLGAFDYISKPPDLNRLLNSVRNGLQRKDLVSENTALNTENKILKKKVQKRYQMIGNSEELKNIQSIIDKVAETDARVLITGQNGTGKELVAHSIHEKSDRNKLPFVEVNCAAIPSELIESELFGHMKGSFTGAVKDKPGKFELAHKGTLFLDEVGDMSLSAQAKVLRALQENKINRVGAEKEINVDVRVLAATNKNLKEEIKNGKFREDLFHRLSVIEIQVPSLNERKDDIPILVNHFLKIIAEEQGNTEKEINQDAIKKLQNFDWTGNIRELRNVVERLIILGENPITKKDVEQFVLK
ncbi:MAG: sigma-54-dependent Fis family transcriptional regulator [Flavobacteriales bacterium]|nr:sigma-54-dependent Fis family transcriptional regulator [Flavobacteriales bacterium]